ncbi:hypothetical protein ACJ73_06088 [Blastomyces percursus]|uniref:Hyaluronan/mRNA-binding protein domain-containing protein n=1 Tax=Blastomyces percursus TaxID=1658174 RepID=A0A1J9Q1T0_9EURO|nr:hypothetical protein ACJ73_06088 [Blastomyces percursus]
MTLAPSTKLRPVVQFMILAGMFSASCLYEVTSHGTYMTRSHKLNDRDHAGIADGTAAPEAHLPRYFAKHGHIDSDPKKTKKDGGGKGNWGRSGEEVHDYGYTFTNARRRSNSSTQGLADFKTKFETVEADPVFEEEIHGPLHEDINGMDGVGLKSNESSTGGTSEADIEVKA